jgi:hypothetical protein
MLFAECGAPGDAPRPGGEKAASLAETFPWENGAIKK